MRAIVTLKGSCRAYISSEVFYLHSIFGIASFGRRSSNGIQSLPFECAIFLREPRDFIPTHYHLCLSLTTACSARSMRRWDSSTEGTLWFFGDAVKESTPSQGGYCGIVRETRRGRSSDEPVTGAWLPSGGGAGSSSAMQPLVDRGSRPRRSAAAYRTRGPRTLFLG